MKYATSILVLVVFLTASLGFALMCHDNTAALSHGSHDTVTITDCFAGFVECAVDGIPMAVSHISAYQDFSNTPVSSFVLTSLLAVVGLAMLALVPRLQPVLAPEFIYARDKRRSNSQASYVSKKKFTSYLALFENSPSFI